MGWGKNDMPSIPQQPQRQDSLDDQLKDLHVVAARLGMYDAADWLWKMGVDPNRERPQTTGRGLTTARFDVV